MKNIDFLYYTYVISGLIPIIFFLVPKKSAIHNNAKENKILNLIFILCLIRFLTDVSIVGLGVLYYNSLPAIHISVLLCYIIVLLILNEINDIFKLNYLVVFGLILFVSDVFFTSSIFSSCLLSSLSTFIIIIYQSIRALQVEKIMKENEKLVGSLLIFYLTACGYYLYQELITSSDKIMNLAIQLFISIQLIFNIILSQIIWSKKKI